MNEFFYLCSLSVLIYVLIQFRYPLQCCRFDVSFQIAETPWPRKPASFAPPWIRRKSVISTSLYVQCDQVQSALSSGAPRSVVLLEKMSGDLRRKKNPVRQTVTVKTVMILWWATGSTVYVASLSVNIYNQCHNRDRMLL